MRARLAIALSAVVLVIGASAFNGYSQEQIANARTTYYDRGVADGKAQGNLKAPAEIQSMVRGFCTGTLVLSWFDASMGVSQSDIATYAAAPRDCAGVRYLGSLPTSNAAGATATDYIFTITQNGKETWWVFTINAAGKIVDIQ